ncbi:PAS domain S-box protein [Thiocystis violacea]|uniref:PAS domain S-box protein n=1 Tax=Thiocystis violacea TaxID=13725 RepID=UPI001903A99D|nr:PAS domain S-box protein [Thiocystis violacea]MBK1718376.1 hypothetical protein [Thiocystis violacea]
MLTPAVALLGSLAVYWFAGEWDQRTRAARFQEDVAVQAQTIQRQLDGLLAEARALAQFHGASPEVDPRAFALFADPLRSQVQSRHTLAWLPRILDSDRTSFEAGVRAEGATGFHIGDYVDGGLVQAARRPEYFPVYRLAPAHGQLLALGHDLGADPAIRAALERARDSGRPAASTRTAETGSQRLILVFVPQARQGSLGDSPEERRRNLDGFAVGVLGARDLMEETLTSFHTPGLDWLLTDSAIPGDAGWIHAHRSGASGSSATPGPAAFEHSALEHRVTLELADRRLDLRAIPAPGAYPPSLWPWGLLALGLGLGAVLTAILEHRRVARARRCKREELFGLFMDHSPALAWIKDADNRYLYVNRTFERRFGWRLADVRGKTDFDLWPSEFAATCVADDPSVPTVNPVHPFSDGFLPEEGAPSQWETLKFPFEDIAGGRFVGGVGIEVTAQRQAELELEGYRRIVEHSKEMLMFVDRDLRYQVVSPAYAKLQGTTPERIRGRLVREVERPEILAQIEPHLLATLAGEPRHFNVSGRDGAGHPRYFESHQYPFIEDGKVRGLIVSLRDVTESERRLDSLESDQADLANLVAARTAELTASESKLRTIFELLPVGISITDPSGRILDCNPASEQLLGITREQHLRRDYDGREWSIIRPDGSIMPASEYASVRAMVEGCPVRDVEMGIVRPRGVTWISVSAMPAGHPDYGVVIVYVDVTERRLAEVALRESEQRWKFALEGPGDGVWDWDVESGGALLSRSWKTMLGFAEDEIENRLESWETRVHPDDKPGVMAALQAHLDGGTPVYTSEHRMRCKDGAWKWVLDRGLVVSRDPDGRPRRVIGAHSDISARKEAEFALQASEARARAIFDVSPVPLAICEARHGIADLNPAFVATFGYGRLEIPTLPDWWSLAYPNPSYRQWVQRAWSERLETIQVESGTLDPLEFEIQCKDGTIRTVMVTATPLGGRFDDQYLATFYDVTDLRRAREEAEQAARIKSEFLANMSHEIRTPMNAVLGLAQMLEQEPLPPDQARMVRQIRSAGGTLLDIINDILDFSRIEAGQLRLETRPFTPVAILAHVHSLMGPMAHAKGLVLRLAIPEGLDRALLGDPRRLQQILVNLIGNAIKFTEQGEVRVDVIPKGASASGIRLRFEVADTGIGIPPERLASLCEPFTQADGTISRRFGGSGLGLSISKQLVELMDGDFGFDSQVGTGSTFWLEASFVWSSDQEPQPAEAPRQDGATGSRLAGLGILVVDDSRINREVVERVLRREGARSIPFPDGRLVLDYLRQYPRDADAVLMDIQMPVMDGLAATRAIRRELGLTELPVIAFSAGVLDGQRQEALEAGFSDFLAKPADLEDMVRLFRRWTKPRSPMESPPSDPRIPGTAIAVETDFPDIQGLDTQRAARLLDHDWPFFLGLLSQFAAAHADTARSLRLDLADGQVSRASTRLHQLRGIGGNIGAQNLVSAALALESAILGQTGDVDSLIEDFETRLSALLAAIAPWRESSEASDPDQGEDRPLEPETLAALRAALASRDLSALDLIETLRPALASHLGQASARALTEAISTLRFEEALARLDQDLNGLS